MMLSALIKREARECILSFCHVRTWQEGDICSQEEGPHLEPNVSTLIADFQPPEL